MEHLNNRAQNYIDEHNLEPLLAEMMNTLVYQKTRTPEVFMIKYLASLLPKEERVKHGIHVPDDIMIQPLPLVKFPAENKNDFLKRHLTKELWNSLKYTKTRFNATINDVINEVNGNVTLPDADALDKYREMLASIINDMHGISTPHRHVEKSNENPNQIFITSHVKFDLVQLAKFEYFRNLKDLPFSHRCNSEHFEEIEKRITLALTHIEKDFAVKEKVKYSENPERFNKIISESSIDIQRTGSLNAHVVILLQNKSDETEAYDTHKINHIVLLNDSAHLRLITSCDTDSRIHLTYERLNALHKSLDDILQFEFDSHFGYINSDVNLLGNGLRFTVDVLMSKFLTKKSSEFEGLKKAFMGTVKDSSVLTVTFTQSLKEMENEFIENIFQKLYNLNYIEENADMAKIENLSLKLFDADEEALFSEREKKFFDCIRKAYQSAYPLYQYSHFYPDNLTLNKVFENVNKNLNNVAFYKKFPFFFNFFISNYRTIYDEIIQRKTRTIVNRNLEDFRDSLVNLETFSFDRVKRLNITIRRNLSLNNLNFPHLLNESQKKEVLNLITDHVKYFGDLATESYEYDEKENCFYLNNKQISIHVNKEDHITFELNVSESKSESEAEMITLINSFFKTYKEISEKLELERNLLGDDSMGYLTNDMRYLGNGLSYVIEVANGDKADFKLNYVHMKDGFYLEKKENEEIVLGCDLNVNMGVYRLFNVTVDLFKALKVATVTQKTKVLGEPKIEDI